MYEMCNDVNSDEILMDKEEMTNEEKERLLARVKADKTISLGKSKKAGKVIAWTAAAAVTAIVILPNTSPQAAYAMSQIPILGNVIKVVTVREYNYESERFEAKINEVQLEQEPSDGATADKTGESISAINESIEEMTNRLIARFEEQVEAGESYGGIYVDHQVVTDTDRWFTLRIDVAEVAGSGVQYQYYYHIDKTTGEIAGLKDLFKEGTDYITPISENIRKQMREQMAEDDYLFYWVEADETGWQFEKIKEDQNFYLNDQGQIVICFDEYEVAPGYMGLVEFTIEDEAVADILK